MDAKQAIERLEKGIYDSDDREVAPDRKAYERDLADFLAFPLRSFRRSGFYREIHRLYFQWDELLSNERQSLTIGIQSTEDQVFKED